DVETVARVNTGYAALGDARAAARGRAGLYTVDLATGAATRVGALRLKGGVRDIAVAPTGRTIRAVDARNRLFTVDDTRPYLVTAQVRVKGLGRGERVVGIDHRPVDLLVTNNLVPAVERLYALTDRGTLTPGHPTPTPGTSVSPDTGQVFAVGPLGVDAVGPVAFDVVTELVLPTTSDTLLAVFHTAGDRASRIYTVVGGFGPDSGP